MPVTSGGAGARPATRGVAGGLRGLALGALAGDGGVGRDRVAVAPGSVPFGEKGTGLGVRASYLPVDTVCVRGEVGDVRSGALRIDAVDAWLAAREVVVQAVSARGSASLDRVALISSSLLRQCQGSVALFLSTIGSSYFSPHINVDIVQHWFGAIKKFPSISLLLRVLAPGAPVGVARGGDLTTELAYGNHPDVATHAVAIHQKICADVVHGRALVFDLRFATEILGLRISPMSVVLEPKLRIIHDLTFARAGDRTSVNGDTDFDSAPQCELGHVLREVLLRVLFLRQTHGSRARILLCRVDVKDAFRQVLVDPAGAPTFGYVFGDHVVVDLRLQFGWRNSPGFWGLMASALEHAHTHSTFQGADVSQQGAAAVAHVELSSPRGVRVVAIPRDCGPVPGSGGSTGSYFFVRYYVDDGILVELQWWPDGRRCLRAVQSLASDHFRLLGERGVSDPPLLSARKTTNWDTQLEVLGWIIDTEALTVTLPSHKRLKLHTILAEWPPSRASASAKQVSQLVGFLMHVSFAVRPGGFFVNRLLASVGMPRIAAGADFAGRMANPGRRLALGPEFHGDLEFWRWFVEEGLDARGGILSAPMYHLLERPPRRTLFSDASKTAVGGFCLETGVYWRYELDDGERSRFCGSSKSVADENDISINVLELLGMVVSAWVLVSACAERPSVMGDCVLLRGDNEAAIQWVRRCRGGKEPRSGTLMRLLGVLELSSGWHFDAKHVRGIFNVAADGISRWDRASVLVNLRAVRPDIPWQEQELGGAGTSLCTSVLASNSCETPLRPRLNALIRGILAHG